MHYYLDYILATHLLRAEFVLAMRCSQRAVIGERKWDAARVQRAPILK